MAAAIDIRSRPGGQDRASQKRRSGAAAGQLPEAVGGGYRHRDVAGRAEAGDRAVLLVEAGRARAPGSACRWCMGSRCSSAARCSCRARSARAPTAVLVLPVATAAPEAGEPGARGADRIRRSAVILFVDDDPLIAMSTTEMLEDLGHRVIGASSGPHALDILKSDQPIDLMMTDHVMPGDDRYWSWPRPRARCAPSAAGPAGHRLCRIARRLRRSTCRGWQSPTIRISCASGSISCWGRARSSMRSRRVPVQILRPPLSVILRRPRGAPSSHHAGRGRSRSPPSAPSCRPCRRRSSAAP